MLITEQFLIASGVGPTQAKIFALPLTRACSNYFITTPARIAGFIAQCQVESVNFTKLEEYLYYTSAERIHRVWPKVSLTRAKTLVRKPEELANYVYANRLGNGGPLSGDGWKFRGRGLFQLSGADNYKQITAATGIPFFDDPELARVSVYAAASAAWFWHKNGLNDYADLMQWDKITRKVNGRAMLAADERRKSSNEILAALA